MKRMALIRSFLIAASAVTLAQSWPADTQHRQDVLASLRHVKSSSSDTRQTDAVVQLIKRLTPKVAELFEVIVDSSYFRRMNSMDSFELQSLPSGQLRIRATSGVAAAAGFHYYLKYFCGCHVSWSGVQLAVPQKLPKLPDPVRIDLPDRFRYYQNVCTVSYSMAFWNWTRWEFEIDWMALNGINLPLAFTGQEAVWQEVYLSLGLTQQELDEHFAGAAFLAWQRMGNLEAWGGPLPVNWYADQLELQSRILSRMRDLGMIPVLPGFAGHVPKALVHRVYPSAKTYALPVWNSFTAPYGPTVLLDPLDPLFHKVGQLFIKTQQSLYNGTEHVYNADVFNEMEAPVKTPEFMSNVSQALYATMVEADPDATWLMQAWLFLESYWTPDLMKAWFGAVPFGRLILLDLASELNPIYSRTAAYYGHPFIWNMIENFGGTRRVYGKFNDVVNGVLSARQNYAPFMIGTGLTPEGIEQNDVIFEIMNEMAWRNVTVDAVGWSALYAKRRYGSSNQQIQDAWKLLIATVYDCKDSHGNGNDGSRVPIIRPQLGPLPEVMWYNPTDLFSAWVLLSQGAVHESDTFVYDLVTIGSQVLEDLSIPIYKSMIASYKQRDPGGVSVNGGKLLDLIQDMDTLLCTDRRLLLGAWLESAKALGRDDASRALLEYNARNQITLWGPNGEIHEYANKNWGGLMASYYLVRWQLFIDELYNVTLRNGTFDQSKFEQEVVAFEKKWNADRQAFPTLPSGDPYTITEALIKKYSHDVSQLWRKWPMEQRAPVQSRDALLSLKNSRKHG